MVDLSQLEKVKTAVDHANEADVSSAATYLNETNWYAFRYLEEGKPIPEDILAKRIAARLLVYPEAI